MRRWGVAFGLCYVVLYTLPFPSDSLTGSRATVAPWLAALVDPLVQAIGGDPALSIADNGSGDRLGNRIWTAFLGAPRSPTTASTRWSSSAATASSSRRCSATPPTGTSSRSATTASPSASRTVASAPTR